eukprot:sb/3465528/
MQCSGSGHAGNGACSTCGGRGIAIAQKKLDLRIPHNCRDGQDLVFEGLDSGDVEVRVVATTRALHFFSPSSLPSNTTLYTDEEEWSSWQVRGDPVLHIELRKWADIMVLAPLDANTLGKLANGLCDNLLTYSGDVEVRVVATTRALHFFSPSSLPSNTTLYTDEEEWSSWQVRGDPVLHIELRKWADIMVLAPLDANTLGKLANGLCDNLLTCITRAWDPSKPVLICPAMNTAMWEHPLTSRHLEVCGGVLGYHQEGPIAKTLVCGDTGLGAMAEVQDIECPKQVDISRGSHGIDPHTHTTWRPSLRERLKKFCVRQCHCAVDHSLPKTRAVLSSQRGFHIEFFFLALICRTITVLALIGMTLISFLSQENRASGTDPCPIYPLPWAGR